MVVLSSCVSLEVGGTDAHNQAAKSCTQKKNDVCFGERVVNLQRRIDSQEFFQEAISKGTRASNAASGRLVFNDAVLSIHVVIFA